VRPYYDPELGVSFEMDLKDIPCEIVVWIAHEPSESIEFGAFLGQMVNS
jgi:hypothetical protein